jgi:glycosidase
LGLLVALILAFVVVGCATPTPQTLTPSLSSSPTPGTALYTGTDGYPWWNNAVFYEIFVRSFYDSNDDGIGDFNGLTSKLDYLNDGDPNTTNDLGITGLWLMPIFPSPSYHGYDVTDYFSVNPQYGTIEDFKRLLDEAHTRGIHVLIDLVLNHTSDRHPWFQQAKLDPNSPYRDWYLWSETDPGFMGPWGERVWHSTPTGYYYGIFNSAMPDLNYTNPAVTQQMDEVVRFWLHDVGVDGFRLDAAKHLIEDGTQQENSDATHEWYKNFRPDYKTVNPQALTVGELFGDDLPTLASYVEGDQLDLAFNFELANGFLNSATNGKTAPATNQLKFSDKLLPPLQYATFLTNHDQNRVLSQLKGNINQAKVAASLLLTSPGVPFIYYGEEIGMKGTKPDENIRRPMQWDASQSAGFTSGTPWQVPDSNYQTFNVAAETNDTASLLTHYRALIQLRAGHPALRVGTLDMVSADNPAIFASLRISQDEVILIVINLGASPLMDYSLRLNNSALAIGHYLTLPLMGGASAADLEVNANSGFVDYIPADLPAYGTLILKLQSASDP